MSEQELAKYFIEHFRDQDLYFEVPASGIIDIVVKMGNITMAVEVKTVFNFTVIEQAFRNKQFCNYSYIAVPEGKGGRSFQEHICRDYGIGILYFREQKITRLAAGSDEFEQITKARVHEAVKAKLNRKVYKVKLFDYQKTSVPGSQNERVTAFGNYVNVITRECMRSGKIGIPAKELFHRAGSHYSSFSVFKSTVARYISGGVIKDLIIEKGVFYHSDHYEHAVN